MHLKVLAFDLDGTLAEDGKVDAKTWETLREARQAGFALILVTGRQVDTFESMGPFDELFEALVAEDGAAIYFPRNEAMVLPFGRLDSDFVTSLERLNLPMERGVSIVATWKPHDTAILPLIRKHPGAVTIEYNRDAVMVLPPGATKGTGLQVALHELGYSMRNVLACGDAENDRSLFEVAEMAVAVANAPEEVKQLADLVLPVQDGEGIRWLVKELIKGQIPHHRLRRQRLLPVGQRLSGARINISPSVLLDGNMAIVGSSTSGKSWLAGLLAEALLKEGYQICVIDPEGDYTGLRAFPHTLVLGGLESRLPAIPELITLSEYTNLSLILDLSLSNVDERASYVTDLMQALGSFRARRGRPHWFLFDEIQNFCQGDDNQLTALIRSRMNDGGFCLVTYQPSHVSSRLLEGVDHWLLTRMQVEDEVQTLQSIIQQKHRCKLEISDLTTLPIGQAKLILKEEKHNPCPKGSTIAFYTARRVVPHVRHLHKYLRAPLPNHRRFYFHNFPGDGDVPPAASLWEFREALQVVSDKTLDYHLSRGDFERWIADVLRDKELARRIRKIAHRPLDRKAIRDALSKTVADRYEELESLI